MTKCINARCETECFDTFCDDRCEAGFLRDANKELKAKLEKKVKTHQEVMKHWMTENKKMMDKANKHFKGVEAENASLQKQVKSLCVAHVDLTEIEQETERDNISLKLELEALRACTSQEIEIKALKGFKASWIELKTQLIFSVENYEEHDTSVVVQVLEEMNKQENLNNIPDTNKKVTANKGRL